MHCVFEQPLSSRHEPGISAISIARRALMTLVERPRRSGPVRTHTASTTRSAGTFSAHARCSFYSSFAGTACRGCERRVYPNKLAVLRGQLDSHDRQAFIRALLRLNGNQGDGPETPFSMVPLQQSHVQQYNAAQRSTPRTSQHRASRPFLDDNGLGGSSSIFAHDTARECRTVRQSGMTEHCTGKSL